MSHVFTRQKCRPLLVGSLLTLICAPVVTLAGQSALELVQTIDLKGRPGNLDHLSFDAKRAKLFVANKVNNTLDIVDLEGGKLFKQLRGQQGVQGLAYAPDLDRLYVALGEGGFCNLFDGKDYKLLKTIKFKDDADNVRYNPRTHLVYVAHAENALAVVDAKTLAVRKDIKLPGAAESFQLEKSRPRLYLNSPPNLVAVIDTDKNEVVEQYTLTSATKNYPLALDEANHRLFIGCRKEPTLVVLDSESGKEVASVPIPSDTDDLYYDAKRKQLYVSCGEGFLAIIRQQDADHYEMLEKMPTVKGARTCFFDPDAGKLFLAVPRQEGKEGPEIRVYQVKP